MDEGISTGLTPHAPSRKDLRVFGLGLGCLLSLFSFLAWRKQAPYASWQTAAAFSFLLALLRPSALLPVYRAWMPVALFLGKANTFIFLCAFYYLIFTPYALLLRLCRTPMLDLGFKDGDSYWRDKEPSDGPESYRRQF